MILYICDNIYSKLFFSISSKYLILQGIAFRIYEDCILSHIQACFTEIGSIFWSITLKKYCHYKGIAELSDSEKEKKIYLFILVWVG